MKKRKVRLGFVGAGYQAQVSRLNRFFRLRNECEMAALAEVKPAQGKRIAAMYDIKELYRDHKELLAKADVDAYVITQMYTRHLTIVPDFLKTGKPVFTEKPVAYSLDAAQKIVDCAKRCKTVHMVGYQLRVDCATQYAKKLMDEWRKTGQYGKLQYVRMTVPTGWACYGGNMDPVLTDEKIPDTASTKPEIPDSKLNFDKHGPDPYNWCVNVCSHNVDAMRFLLGEKLKLAFTGKDALFMVLEGARSGVQGVIEFGLVNQKSSWTHTDTIYFENASLEIQRPPQLGLNVQSKLTIYRDEEQPRYEQPVMPFKDPMLCEAEAFLKVVRGEIAPPCTSAEAMEAMQTCWDFAQRALGRGRS